MNRSDARSRPPGIAKAVLVIIALSIAVFQQVEAAESVDKTTLIIATWGGAYERAQQKALFEPFEKISGIRIETLAYNGELSLLEDKNQSVDVIDLLEQDARAACSQGLLMRLDTEKLIRSQSHSADRSEYHQFLPGSFSDCSINHITYATVMALDIDAFPGLKPRRIGDFFDLKKFPGKRGLYRSPDIVLEWALLAEGVPLSQVYDLLSTERGLALAFRRLDTIRDQIVWWSAPEEPATLLASGKVVMSSAYNGRIFEAQTRNKSLSIIWDGQIIDKDAWGIPATAGQPELARSFIRFALQPRQMARLAEHIPYGPTRYDALEQVGRHPTLGIDMLEQLPTAAHNLQSALIKDADWYVNTARIRKRRFNEWLDRY
jgi:putative spermidine/putrescine transport system substrate-binding protein